MRLAFFIIILAVLVGCDQSNKRAKTENKIEAELNCQEIEGLESLLTKGGPEIIIIGELHGTKEPPAFIEALTCNSLRTGLKTALALEISGKEGGLERYLTSDGGNAARTDLFEDSMWSTDFTDGRSSEAMLRLIEWARRMHQSRGLTVIKFVADELNVEDYYKKLENSDEVEFDRQAYSQIYEKKMAENILTMAKEAGVDKTFVLVGNTHAKRSNVQFGESSYQAMAGYMPKPRTLTLNTVYTDGTSWNCLGLEPTDCGSSETGGSINPESDIVKLGSFRIVLAEGRVTIPGIGERSFHADTYDGIAYIGAATASPPANIGGRKPNRPSEAE